MEQFKNNAVTALNAGINNSVTSLVVTSATGFPTSGNFRILIDSEILTVTGVASDTFTVTRSAEGTSAASHSSGAIVTHILTSGALSALVDDQFQLGVDASRPSSLNNGQVYRSSDDMIDHLYKSSAYKLYERPGIELTPVVDGNFSWLNNIAGSSKTVTNGAVTLKVNRGASYANQLVGRYETAPATPYRVYVRMQATFVSANFRGYGLFFRQNSNGRCTSINHWHSSVLNIAYSQWNTATTFNTRTNFGPAQIFPWMSIEDDGTNRNYYVSMNGIDWITIFTEGRTTFLTADQIGFAIIPETQSTYSNSTNPEFFLRVLSYKR